MTPPPDIPHPTAAARQLPYSDETLTAMRAALARLEAEGGRDYLALLDGMLDSGSLRAALGLPEESVDALYAQAFARFNAGDARGARQVFQALCLLAPERVDHWLGFGICLVMDGEETGAALAFDAAVDLAPDAPAPRYHRAELLCRARRWAEARRDVAAFAALEDSPARTRLAAEVQRLAALVEHHGA
ncbi:tetratricopeptide repeat protein [Pseudooceanicola aestuarii]|uniref:tetratricopeptide repeat protein n=1 Tax=Pseudooceanicola aestuarii TaxID=2697319 RepID=UPI0013D0AAFE|nr:tetratricopeptide repeat protein [Pseudooceanicola aestuarii]